MKMNGGQALIKSLEMEGVEVVFGLPGGAILPVYDPIIDSPIRHILVRHEQGAGHMAEGYAHATGRPGVAMVTSGPGATNIVTPLADAMMDSIPMVVITGQVPTHAIGLDAFQECDTVGITRPIVKHNMLVKDVKDLASAMKKAFHIATTGRPGRAVKVKNFDDYRKRLAEHFVVLERAERRDPRLAGRGDLLPAAEVIGRIHVSEALALHLLDVGAGGERLLAAGQHQAALPGVGVIGGEGVDQLLEHGRVERV